MKRLYIRYIRYIRYICYICYIRYTPLRYSCVRVTATRLRMTQRVLAEPGGAKRRGTGREHAERRQW